MNNDITTTNGQLMTPASNQVSLLEMRMDENRFPRIGKYTREQAVFEMSKIVSQAFLYKGQAADSKNIQFISCALVDELQSDLDGLGTKNISFEEISRIVKRAILTDDIFLSVSSFYKVIMNYIKGEGHQLQKQIIAERKKADLEQIKKAPVYQMLTAYAAEMAKQSKV